MLVSGCQIKEYGIETASSKDAHEKAPLQERPPNRRALPCKLLLPKATGPSISGIYGDDEDDDDGKNDALNVMPQQRNPTRPREMISLRPTPDRRSRSPD